MGEAADDAGWIKLRVTHSKQGGEARRNVVGVVPFNRVKVFKRRAPPPPPA